MFSRFYSMLGDGDSLSINIMRKGDQLVTSLIPKKADLKDTAKDLMKPLVISGTPEELEAGFIDAVAQPIAKATGILTNLQEFEASADKAAADSKAAKAGEEKKKKELDAYTKLLKQVDDFEKAKKYKAAVDLIKKAGAMSVANASVIKKRTDALMEKLNTGSLFGADEPEEENTEEIYNTIVGESDSSSSTDDEEEENEDDTNEEEEE